MAVRLQIHMIIGVRGGVAHWPHALSWSLHDGGFALAGLPLADASARSAIETRCRLALGSGRQRYRGDVSTEHLDELRRRLAEQMDQGSADDRVTTDRLARMRHRLSELEHISESTTNEAEARAAEDEVHGLMASLENVRDLAPSRGRARRESRAQRGPGMIGQTATARTFRAQGRPRAQRCGLATAPLQTCSIELMPVNGPPYG